MAILNNSNAISTAGGYDINNSLRFRSSASAYLSRTFSTPTSNTTWTLSFWNKRGALSGYQTLISAGTSAIDYVTNTNTLIFFSAGPSTAATSTSVYRDPAAWGHWVITSNGTTVVAYFNNVSVLSYTGTLPQFNSAIAHTIGSFASGGDYFDGYMAEVNFIDGQALTPSSFGETDTTTGSWKPKAYTSTYGTNGFYLKFSDIATTSGSNAGLGKDFSGNTNYWTTNNISVTAGTTYDAMTDVPTNTSATAANYAVVNPLDKNSSISVAQGNLNISTTTSGANQQIRATIALPDSGKWYWETTNSGSVNNFNAGITQLTASLSVEGAGDLLYNENGIINNNGTTTSGYSTLALNDIMGLAYDADANKLYFYKNNVLVNTGGTTPSATGPFAPMFGMYDSGNAQQINFGQRPFAYTPPTGFVRLNTFNLPTPTILQGNKYMDATLYTGTGTTQVIVNQALFQPDFVWAKRRSSIQDNVLFDSVRGVTKWLVSNATSAEGTYATSLTSFNSNGFTLGGINETNASGSTYVGWQWQAGQGTTSSNTSGSITSTVSVNTTAGFSIVTYTSQASGTATFGHGLGVAPSMIFLKARNLVGGWYVYHSALGGTQYLALQTTGAVITAADGWNNTNPTSTVVSVGNGYAGSYNMVAYCWAEIAGFSKFGSYTGNGSADGPFVYLGFRPKFLLIYNTAGGDFWNLLDSSRDTYNASGLYLAPNNSNAEGDYRSLYPVDFLSNGFKIRNASFPNSNGNTFIYMAFAEVPTKFSNAR